MPRIKLLRTQRSYDIDDNWNGSTESFSDWEEVTQEELNWLNTWQSSYVDSQYRYIVIVEDVTPKIQDRIKSIKDFIKQEDEKAAKQKAKEEKDKEDRKKKAEAKKVAAAKKLLEEKGIL